MNEENSPQEINPDDFSKVPNKQRFNFLIFESLIKTKTYPYQEWVGSVDEGDRVFVMNYENKELKIAIDKNEIRARNNLTKLAESSNHTDTLTINEIINKLDLKWKLPEGFIDE